MKSNNNIDVEKKSSIGEQQCQECAENDKERAIVAVVSLLLGFGAGMISSSLLMNQFIPHISNNVQGYNYVAWSGFGAGCLGFGFLVAYCIYKCIISSSSKVNEQGVTGNHPAVAINNSSFESDQAALLHM